MRRALFLSLCLLVGAVFTRADRVLAQGGYGGVVISGNLLDVAPVNQSLSAAGYEKFSGTFFGFGGWGFFVGERVLLGGSGWGFTQSRKSPSATARLSGGAGFFDFGYVVSGKGPVRVALLGGFGGGGFTLDLIPSSMESDFGKIVQNPRLMARLTAGQMLLKLGLQIDRAFSVSSQESRSLLIVGLRTEYLVPLGQFKWKAEEVDIRGMPDLSLAGLRIGLIVGFGGAAGRE